MKPVRLPAAATLALPRWALFALCLLYIIPGLLGRDPWKPNDAASFGIMWTMAQGGLNDWLFPNIVGLPMANEGPLAFWVGAICIKLFSWLIDPTLAARIATVMFFLLGCLAVWYTTYLFGRRPEVQPLRLAFGGQPEARDYGRTLADGALLIYLGCIGLLLHSHSTTSAALEVSLAAFSLYGAARLLEMRTMRSAAVLGLGLGLLTLSYGWVIALALFLSLLVLAAIRDRSLILPLLLVTLPIALMPAAAWAIANTAIRPYNRSAYSTWMLWNFAQIGIPSWQAIKYFLSNAIWFAWPAWPFAGWAIYAWRRQYQEPHITLPLSFLAATLIVTVINPHVGETNLLPMLPPLAILAAYGLPTMKRGAINAVDWFSVMTLTTCAAFIWLGWIAKQTGWPAWLARNAFKLAPGFKPEFSLIAFSVAAAASIGWISLVHWRISRRPSVLWRAVVLSSGGVILCWLLLNTLWLPWINYGKSYAGVAKQLAQQLPSGRYCVDSNVGSAQRASFAYFGDIPFARFGDTGCRYLLLQGGTSEKLITRNNAQWELLWEGRRPADRDERFRLYRRIN